MMFFWFFLVFLLFQRIVELSISRRNERWLLAQGAVEYGQMHFPFVVLLHVCFIISLAAEYLWIEVPNINYLFLGFYLILLVMKTWVVTSLGKYWNVKIYRIPGSHPIKKGLYKFIKHPNYLIVVCEIMVISLTFQLYYTAVIFSMLNAIILSMRIKAENEVWRNKK